MTVRPFYDVEIAVGATIGRPPFTARVRTFIFLTDGGRQMRLSLVPHVLNRSKGIVVGQNLLPL